MHASLGLLLEVGMEHVSELVLRNTDLLLRGLKSMAAVSVRSFEAPERRSGIVSFGADQAEPRAVFRVLVEAGVSCALREGNIRLSPHFYQDEAVIEKLLERVEDALHQ
jgi:selenocysteine lyase/cysteine desulfurase